MCIERDEQLMVHLWAHNRQLKDRKCTWGSRAMLCVILSKHNVKPNIFAHVKSDDCGEHALRSLSGDRVVHSSTVNPIWLLVGLPKSEGHAGLSKSQGESHWGPRVGDKKGGHSAMCDSVAGGWTLDGNRMVSGWSQGESQLGKHKYAQREMHSSAPICDHLQRLCC